MTRYDTARPAGAPRSRGSSSRLGTATARGGTPGGRGRGARYPLVWLLALVAPFPAATAGRPPCPPGLRCIRPLAKTTSGLSPPRVLLRTTIARACRAAPGDGDLGRSGAMYRSFEVSVAHLRNCHEDGGSRRLLQAKGAGRWTGDRRSRPSHTYVRLCRNRERSMDTYSTWERARLRRRDWIISYVDIELSSIGPCVQRLDATRPHLPRRSFVHARMLLPFPLGPGTFVRCFSFTPG